MNGLTFSLLRLLADGEFHSGQALATRFGVTRATVWNALEGVEQAGLVVFRVRGRGYRLAQALTLLDAASIATALGSHARRFTLDVLDSVDSTNTLLLQRATAGAPGGSVIAAEWQTRGRGRRGREWHALPGAALTFSLLWRFQQGVATLAGLSLAVGVAVTRALAALGAPGIGLKWPNDLLWRQRKLGGILTEVQGDALGPSAAVIGIGLNASLPAMLRDRIDQPAADLEAICGAAPDRNRVLALLLIELARVLDAFAHDGFAPLREEWQRHHEFQLRPVQLALPDGGVIEGTAQGVADDGSLLLLTPGGLRRVHGGEVSLRQQGTGSRHQATLPVTRP